ncbi:DUF2934 domain-containing protein [Steroidobacter sp. S1-65]|uniref:DUF2934 domain-containing protein n=1 Tax=Steroidobacter gossypii TaxID=2805490 RepID=A0ABS1WTB3_9GAMM|nr:DUF2934 domain-containing protein [Steroidobacter gossypii]MBM0104205.1 DUF2934 domain-containing protein [Steroidobacter gossypii]
MEFTPDTSPPKRTRAKPKIAAGVTAQTPSAVVKKPRAPRKTPTSKTAPAAPATEVQVVAATLDPTREDVGTMIATAAYYLAAARNFSPGHELDDWLEAERAIHAKLYG